MLSLFAGLYNSAQNSLQAYVSLRRHNIAT